MLDQAVESYVEVRRATGFEFKSQCGFLRSFATFSKARGKDYVCSEIAIEWAGSATSVFQRARRLGMVIRFARYIRAEDQRHEIPPAVYGTATRPRSVPFIFSGDEIQRIVQAATQLGHPDSLRCYTYSTLFGLLACTGLRISEAIRLRFEDITPDGLMIRSSKFRKSRLVPLQESTQLAVERYLQRRCPYAPFDDHLFVSTARRPLLPLSARIAFNTVVQKIGLPRGPGLPRPTLHALRHSFAVRALESCPDNRDRITKHMLALSTYLGHTNVGCTYWYLEATADLMRNVAATCEHFVTGGRP